MLSWGRGPTIITPIIATRAFWCRTPRTWWWFRTWRQMRHRSKRIPCACIFRMGSNAPVLSVPSQYSTIRSAYNAAGDCNIIRISSGIYHETVPFNLTKHVRLESQGGPATRLHTRGAGQTTLGPQQLRDVPAALHHVEQPLPAHLLGALQLARALPSLCRRSRGAPCDDRPRGGGASGATPGRRCARGGGVPLESERRGGPRVWRGVRPSLCGGPRDRHPALLTLPLAVPE